MFFGTFRHFDGKKFYGDEKHIIFGYLQVGEVLTKKEVKKYTWHPHADKEIIDYRDKEATNVIYTASEKFKCTDYKGYGVFKYHEDLVLTAGQPKSFWKLPKVFNEVTLTYHGDKVVDSSKIFKSAGRGQEFVIKGDATNIVEWIKGMVEKNTFNQDTLLKEKKCNKC